VPASGIPAAERAPVRTAPDRHAGTRALLLASVVIWGSTFVAMKEVLLAHVTPFELVGLRFAIGLPVLAGVLWAKKIPLAFDRRDLRPLAIGSAIILVHFLVQPFALSFEKTTATNTGWIISFSPLGIALLSWLILGERLGTKLVLGIAMATLGVLLLVSKGDFTSLAWLASAGDWLILLTSLTWALYTIATRDLSRRRSPLAVTLVVFTPLCLLCLALMASRSDWSRFGRLPPRPLAALLFLGILGTLAQWFWQLGVARIGAARAGVYLYLEPVATTALAVPLLGESFGVWTAAGGLLLLAGVWWAQREPAPALRRGAEEPERS
jgi:drug/metabolite transporter (DMT)-like permease